VSDTLRTFSEKDQTFVRLYYVDGLSPEEVAAEMSISVKTVYSKKHKIRSRLEQALAPLVSEAA
jgi:RNA polymerase sigma-70 factor (ECF subfamily)